MADKIPIPDINSVLKEICTQLAEAQVEVKQLQKLNEVRKVAFSASLLVSGSTTIGPFETRRSLIFRNATVNIGKAYNPQTGKFTAPVKGAYHFEFHIYGPGSSSYAIGAILMKNDELICTAHVHQNSEMGSCANGFTLPLEVGDVVSLSQSENSQIYDDVKDNYNIFSGHLLYIM